MGDKLKPPRLDEDFTEEEFDRLLESKFGIRDDLFGEGKEGGSNLMDKTPANIENRIESDDTKVPETQEKETVLGGDPYDYTIPETREAWLRLKNRVNELEEANQDLLNQLDLRDEMDDTSSNMETEIDALRSEISGLKNENHELLEKISDFQQEIENIKREKTVLTKGLEREQSSLNQVNLKLMEDLAESEKRCKSFKDNQMRLEKELLEEKRIAEDERQKAKAEFHRQNEELANKEHIIEELLQQSANQMKEKSSQHEKILREREEEYHTGILALQKEKNAIMDELSEQVGSLQKYVSELEKEREDWGQTRDQLTMKVGLLEDEKRLLNEQNIALVQESQSLTHEMKEQQSSVKNKRDELKTLVNQITGLLDQLPS